MAPPVKTPTLTEQSADERIYTRRFWIAFAANVMLVTSNTLTFRFAEFVKFLHGTEETTGFIVSIGLIGSLVFRAFLGQAIDHFGIRRMWLICAVFNLTGAYLMLTTSDLGGQLYAARIIFVIGLTGMFACSVSHIQVLAPNHRRTEIIGTFGASGFLGMITGSQLGDVLFNTFPASSMLYHLLFGMVMVFGLLHTGLAFWLTSRDRHERPAVSPPIHKLLLRYWPMNVLIVTTMMGMGFAVTMTFLTRYSTQLGLGGIRTFFTAYAITAFLMRIIARDWSKVMGRHRMIAMGLCAHGLGHLLMTFVSHDWHFIPPAMCLGFGHAFLFPCVVSMGAGAFPEQYRGTGTTVTLATIDLGTMLTAPLLGWIIDHQGFYPMFYFVSGSLLLVGCCYGLMTYRITDSDVTLHQAAIQPVSIPTCRVRNELEPEVAATSSVE